MQCCCPRLFADAHGKILDLILVPVQFTPIAALGLFLHLLGFFLTQRLAGGSIRRFNDIGRFLFDFLSVRDQFSLATVVPFFKHLPRCVGILPVLALIPLDDFAFAIYNDDIHRIFSVSTIRFQHLSTIFASCCFGIQVKSLCMVLFRNIPVQIRVLAGHTSLSVNSVVKLLVSCIQRLIQPSQIDRGFLRRHCRN